MDRRGGCWPEILFGLIVSVMLVLQFGLEVLSVGMGLSCDVTGLTQRAPWFVGVSTLIVSVALVGFDWQRALRAAGHAAAVQLMLSGWLILTLFAWGRCYSQEFPSFLERHPHPIGWALLGGGAVMLAVLRVISYLARHSQARSTP